MRYRDGVHMEQLRMLFRQGYTPHNDVELSREQTAFTLNIMFHPKVNSNDFDEMIIPVYIEEADQIPSNTTMSDMHLMFVKHALNFGFVTRNGQLVGILRRKRLETILTLDQDSTKTIRRR